MFGTGELYKAAAQRVAFVPPTVTPELDVCILPRGAIVILRDDVTGHLRYQLTTALVFCASPNDGQGPQTFESLISGEKSANIRVYVSFADKSL